MADMAIDSAGGGKAVFGSKPGVAEFTETDLGAESKKAAAANTRNLPEIESLLEKIMPGWKSMVGQGSKNAQSMLRGEIPDDVQGLLRRNAAYKAFSGGYGGSGMSKALTARDFGLTSLDLMNKGENSAMRWMGAARESVAPWMVTGPAQAQQTERNNLYKQAVEQFKFNVLAAPSPEAAGKFNTISTIGSLAASFGLSSMGGAMGGKAGTAAGSAASGASYGGNLGNTAQLYSGWGG